MSRRDSADRAGAGAGGAPSTGARRREAEVLPGRVRVLRIALYISLMFSLLAALFIEPAVAGAVARNALHPAWLFTAIGAYGVFFVIFAIDRVLLIKRGRYPSGKAFFQVALVLVFPLMLLPSTIHDYSSRPSMGMGRLLAHADPEVRAVAVEAVFMRGATPENIRTVLERRQDDDIRVRDAALKVLAQWAGRDQADVAGIEAWASALSKTTTVGRDGNNL